jgi:hypothetical protein
VAVRADGTAYALAKVLNVLWMSSTSVRVYLWSRKLVRPLLGVAVAAPQVPVHPSGATPDVNDSKATGRSRR